MSLVINIMTPKIVQIDCCNQYLKVRIQLFSMYLIMAGTLWSWT